VVEEYRKDGDDDGKDDDRNNGICIVILRVAVAFLDDNRLHLDPQQDANIVIPSLN